MAPKFPPIPRKLARSFIEACAVLDIELDVFVRNARAAWLDPADTPPLDVIFDAAGRADLASLAANLRLHSPRLAHALASCLLGLVVSRPRSAS